MCRPRSMRRRLEPRTSTQTPGPLHNPCSKTLSHHVGWLPLDVWTKAHLGNRSPVYSWNSTQGLFVSGLKLFHFLAWNYSMFKNPVECYPKRKLSSISYLVYPHKPIFNLLSCNVLSSGVLFQEIARSPRYYKCQGRVCQPPTDCIGEHLSRWTSVWLICRHS